ncbi:MAG: DUF721 domain-containing protein [Sedimentisphaerales bacterium]|nr:DUF721 domain-containing protein [Sedimentisphaerales bacterium]
MTELNAQPLGETLKDVMENFISPRQRQIEQLMKVWSQLLPDELAGHCDIVEFSSGVLKVRTGGPGYSHELRLCRKMLLNEMNEALTGVRVKDIRMSV